MKSLALVPALVAALVLALPVPILAQGNPISDPATLASILGDQEQIEDFEGFSLSGGTSTPAPNPLNSSTKPQWGLLSGVSYGSLHNLAVYTGQLLGDDSNILAGVGSANNDVTISFGVPQLAVGFYLVDITGNLDYHETITFLNGTTALGSVNLTLPKASAQFLGWKDTAGITSVRVTSDAFAMVDNVTWGVTATPVAWANLGSGLAGVAGIPSLSGTGSLVAGSGGSLVLSSARPSAPALLLVSLSGTPVPFKGGTLLAFPPVLTAVLVTSGAGSINLPFNWPAGVPSATSLWFQCLVADAAAVGGVALSNGLKGVTP